MLIKLTNCDGGWSVLQFLDYISSYFVVVGVVWYFFIIGIKFIPIILKWNNGKIEKWQIRTLILSIPSSLIIGIIIFNYFNLYSYLKVI